MKKILAIVLLGFALFAVGTMTALSFMGSTAIAAEGGE